MPIDSKGVTGDSDRRELHARLQFHIVVPARAIVKLLKANSLEAWRKSKAELDSAFEGMQVSAFPKAFQKVVGISFASFESLDGTGGGCAPPRP